MSKDYYKILGVEKNASADEIKKSFRKLAHQYHPDKKGGDETKFKEVNEAYQVVGDKEKRAKYDQFGSDFAQQGGFGGGAGWEDFMRSARGQGGVQFDFGNVDLGDLFGGMFGGQAHRGSRTRRGNDVQVDVELSFHDAAFGGTRDIRLTKNNPCAVCGGNGQEPGSRLNQCDTCHGRGQTVQMQRTILGSVQTATICQTCAGMGQVPEKRCKHCGGTGVTRGESSYSVKIPAGIDTGESLRLLGKGEAGGAGAEAGDLYVIVHVRDDERFARDGADISSEIHVSYPQAALGDTVEIETLDGKKKIVVPEGTQPRQQIRLRGFGIPHMRDSGRGDHYVTVIVDVPKKVSRTGRKLLEDLKKEL